MHRLAALLVVGALAACARPAPSSPGHSSVEAPREATSEALFRWQADRAEHFAARAAREERFRRLARRHAVAALAITVPPSKDHDARAAVLHEIVDESSFGIPYPDAPNVAWHLVGPAACIPLFRVLTAQPDAGSDAVHRAPGKLVSAPRLDAKLTFDRCEFSQEDGGKSASQCPTTVGFHEGTCQCPGPPGRVACECARPAQVPIIEQRPCEVWSITSRVSLHGSLAVAGIGGNPAVPRGVDLAWTDVVTARSTAAPSSFPGSRLLAPEPVVPPSTRLSQEAADPGQGYVGILEREAAGLAVEAAFAGDDDDAREIACAELNEVSVLSPNPRRLALGAFAAAKTRCAPYAAHPGSPAN
jgi:hypothetical protein